MTSPANGLLQYLLLDRECLPPRLDDHDNLPSHASHRFFVLESGYGFTRIAALKLSACSQEVYSSGDLGKAVTISTDRLASEIFKAGKDLGYTDAQASFVSALYSTCDVQKAATLASVSYHTGREYLKAARMRAGFENSATMLSQLIVAAAGGHGNQKEDDSFLKYLFDLTDRQIELAREIALGESRELAARKLGITTALAKKELNWIFEVTGVANALELVRLFGEARALAMLLAQPEAKAVDVRVPATAQDLIVHHESGRQIGLTDYGPGYGRPVFVLHSSMTARFVNRALVEELQVTGYRPLAIDRPGFGNTDLMPDIDDPFEAAALDMLWYCDSVGIGSLGIVTRGAAQVVLALHKLAADRIEAVVLVNPDPDLGSSTKADGPFGAMRLAFQRRPFAIRAITRMLSAISNPARRRHNLRRYARKCPPDDLVMQDDDNADDYLRALAPVVNGAYEGFIREQVALSTQSKPKPLKGTTRWAALVGEEDFIHHPHEVIRYWQDVLPEADVRGVSGAGRFLAYSHAREIVATFIKLTK